MTTRYTVWIQSILLIAVATLVLPACGDAEDSRQNPTNAAHCAAGQPGAAGASSQEIGGAGGATSGSTKPASYLGQTWKHVPIVGGGFVTGLIYNETEPGLVYARTDIGGLYRRDSASQRWIPLSDWVGANDVDLTGIESVATDPVNPDRLYVAAGLYTNSWSANNGVILRSQDRGRSFEQTAMAFKFGGNMPGRSMGERLAVDPNHNDIIYYGARSGNGLWRSTNAGVSFSRVESFTTTGDWADPNFNDAVGIVWVLFDRRSSTQGTATQTIYVGVADTQTAIHRSRDGGVTWEPVPGQPENGYLPHHGVLANNGLLYVTYSDGAGPYDGKKGDVWKYDTNDERWALISPIASSSDKNYFGYGGLAVDARHPNTLVVSSMNAWWPDSILFRSLNAGESWSRIWDWNGYPGRTLRYTQDISASPWLNFGVTEPVAPIPAVPLGWMIGDIEIDPFDSERMMYVTGATVYGTYNLSAWDSGGTVAFSVAAQGIEECAVNDLISPPAGAHLLSALGDLGGFRHDSLTKVMPSVMTNPLFTSGTSLDFAELEPNVIVRVGYVNTDVSKIRVAFSEDGGSTWRPSATQPPDAEGGLVAVAADASRVLWRPAQGTIHYTVDGGATWTDSTFTAVDAWMSADRVNPLKFYAFSGGRFYVSEDGGGHFNPTAEKGLPNQWVMFKAVSGREGDIWLAGGSVQSGRYGLWHSVDSGQSFAKVQNVAQADSIGFGHAAPGQDYPALYAVAQVDHTRGIFRSDDQGNTWVRINDDQHQYGNPWMAITGDPRIYGRVYLATGGRGIVYSDINDPLGEAGAL